MAEIEHRREMVIDFVGRLHRHEVSVAELGLVGVFHLQSAVKLGLHAEALALIQAGPIQGMEQTDSHTTFFDACRRGNLQAVREAIALADQDGTKEKWCDDHGRTGLVEASRCGHVDIVKELRHAGVDASVQDTQGSVPIVEASRCGHVGIVQELLEMGVDANMDDADGCLALVEASRRGHLGVVQVLRAMGADANMHDGSGGRPLAEASFQGHTPIVEELREMGADANAESVGGALPLALASIRGRAELVRTLVAMGANPNAVGGDGHLALVDASRYGHSDVVRELLALGADVDATDGTGQTALAVASVSRRHGVVRQLLAAGASAVRADDGGALPIVAAVVADSMAVVQELAGAGVDVNAVSGTHPTALVAVCRTGNLQIAHLLRDMGADANQRCGSGKLPLVEACKHGHINIVRMLLRMGAVVHARDAAGQSALEAACQARRAECVRELGKNGADVDPPGRKLMTLALEKKFLEVITALLELGATLSEEHVYRAALEKDFSVLAVLSPFLPGGVIEPIDGGFADALRIWTSKPVHKSVPLISEEDVWMRHLYTFAWENGTLHALDGQDPFSFRMIRQAFLMDPFAFRCASASSDLVPEEERDVIDGNDVSQAALQSLAHARSVCAVARVVWHLGDVHHKDVVCRPDLIVAALEYSAATTARLGCEIVEL